MLVGVGVDLVAVERVARLWKRYGKRFLRFFAEEEVAYARSRARGAEALAGAWAAKEALGKALGTGLSGFSPREVALVRRENGAPELRLSGRVARILEERKARAWVSLTHEAGVAAAVVILERS
ncbi:holo-[acyl-carrier-protein] synthase [Thermosulfurimonas marina]|uniref:Holo-[acyl-carrier-protein] synthase n=1 Tax=Thermosulfurimonas marina TaxID=2047767 RepID=A0A6H1WTI8_9BACT|nr:holo-ACP synthase [Thermosulfurimonas marina]QJA06464.1 holo-[acyl-carrier-protein] synthase [Thermosulfurimonas marina]